MHEHGEAGATWPISRRLVIAGALGIVILIGVAAGGGSYLAARTAVSPVASTTTQTPVAVPTVTVPAAGTTPTISPSPLPTTAAAATTSATARPQAAGPAQTARPTPPTKTVSTTAAPPARTTRPSPVCVPDPTWAVRQEQARISREAQRFDMNVQINMAINSGDLDEAARLQNDMQALEQQWVIEDQLDPEPAC